MITPKTFENNPGKVVFGPCRLSYTHVFSKYVVNGDEKGAKYMTNILIPKTETATVNAIKAAIDAARKAGIVSKWSGKDPKNLESPLRDGDDKDDETYEGHYYINAKSATRPDLVDRNSAPIVDEEDIYSGVWCIASVTFYPYNSNGNRGIACGLNSLMKFKDDDRLGGRSSASHDFEGIIAYDDDDDDV